MAKAVLVSLSVDIPDTQQGQAATVTVGTTSYVGKIDAIIVYTPASSVPLNTTVKLTAPGLVVSP